MVSPPPPPLYSPSHQYLPVTTTSPFSMKNIVSPWSPWVTISVFASKLLEEEKGTVSENTLYLILYVISFCWIVVSELLVQMSMDTHQNHAYFKISVKFLYASTHLYKRVRPPVRPSVRPSVSPWVRGSVTRMT